MTSAANGGPACWNEVRPYPFGATGDPVDPTTPECTPTLAGDVLPCYLTVTSMTFRSWNRGLAATDGGTANPFGIWIFNGTRWFPDPTFPGQRICQGNTVIWAGKLDYWLIGPGPNQSWPSVCRFDGVDFTWEPLGMPKGTLARVTQAPTPARPSPSPDPGGITTGTCAAWNDCWFFGTYGTRVHWDGSILKDASPDVTQPWLWGEYTAAVQTVDATGAPSALAAAATGARAATSGPLPAADDGSPPPQLFASAAGAFAPLPYGAPTIPQPGDPRRTDIVALASGAGAATWGAGDPAGFRARFAATDIAPAGRVSAVGPDLAPLFPLLAGAPDASCPGPPATRFTYTQSGGGADTYLWSSIATVPGDSGALAAGRLRRTGPGNGPNDAGAPEPVIVRVACDGTTTETRFSIPDPTIVPAAGATGPTGATGATGPTGPQLPADRLGTVTAVVADAPNDAWAATSRGALPQPAPNQVPPAQQPRLYRFTDGLPPAGAAGDDVEPRPLDLKLDPPIYIDPPPAPPPPPAPKPVIRKTHTKRIAPAIFDVRPRRVGLTLRLTFRVRRRTTIGIEGLRNGEVIASTGLVNVRPPRGRLVLHLSRESWPTRVRFIDDLPKVRLKPLRRTLTGTVGIAARVSALPGRRITSARFEYSEHGRDSWIELTTRKRRPWHTTLDTTWVEPGRYDFRVIVTDSRKRVAASPMLVRRISTTIRAAARPAL